MKKNINGNRLALLRQKRGWSQDTFAEKFSEFAPRYNKDGSIKPPYQTMTISNWETGRKVPPSETLLQLAAFYNVSFDYICGRTNEETPTTTSNDYYKVTEKIPYNKLSDYDGLPVYMVFNDPLYDDQWGLIDIENSRVICKDGLVSLCHNIEYYQSIPLTQVSILSNDSKYLLNMRDMMASDKVYVESLSDDVTINEKIKGWYSHTPDKMFLMNKANGYTLPYEGLGITYNAYSFR